MTKYPDQRPLFGSTIRPGRGFQKAPKRMAKQGKHWKRRKAVGEIEGPLRDFVMGDDPGTGICDSCGCHVYTLRADHVKKRGMGGAIGDFLPNGDGNLVRLCFDCDKLKELTNQFSLDTHYPNRPKCAAIAKAHGEAFKAMGAT